MDEMFGLLETSVTRTGWAGGKNAEELAIFLCALLNSSCVCVAGRTREREFRASNLFLLFCCCRRTRDNDDDANMDGAVPGLSCMCARFYCSARKNCRACCENSLPVVITGAELNIAKQMLASRRCASQTCQCDPCTCAQCCPWC